VLERGYKAIKTNLIPLSDRPDAVPGKMSNDDVSPSTLRNVEAVIGTFRESLGPDIGITIDIALNFKLGAAIKIACALGSFDMMWLETETYDAEVLRLIRDSTTTPICTGESLFGMYGYRPFLERHAMDVMMPDFAWNGIMMGKTVCDLAHAYDTLIAPPNCHSPIKTLVSANVAATVPNFKILEFDVDDAPWRYDIMIHPLEIENGVFKLSDRPGLGSNLIESELEKHPYIWHEGAR